MWKWKALESSGFCSKEEVSIKVTRGKGWHSDHNHADSVKTLGTRAWRGGLGQCRGGPGAARASSSPAPHPWASGSGRGSSYQNPKGVRSEKAALRGPVTSHTRGQEQPAATSREAGQRKSALLSPPSSSRLSTAATHSPPQAGKCCPGLKSASGAHSRADKQGNGSDGADTRSHTRVVTLQKQTLLLISNNISEAIEAERGKHLYEFRSIDLARTSKWENH